MKTNLKDNEEVVLTVRKHWLVLLNPVLWTLVWLALAIVAVVFGSDTEYGDLIRIGSAVTVALSVIWLSYKIIDRHNNLWAVTNLRVIDEFGVFSNNATETPLDKINNVSYHQPFLGRILNYGDVLIQSAAEAGATINRLVERPGELKDAITQYQEQYKQDRLREQARSLAGAAAGSPSSGPADIPDELMKLYDLKEKGILTDEEFQELKARILNR